MVDVAGVGGRILASYYRCGSEMGIAWLVGAVAETKTKDCMLFSLCQCHRLPPIGEQLRVYSEKKEGR